MMKMAIRMKTTRQPIAMRWRTKRRIANLTGETDSTFRPSSSSAVSSAGGAVVSASAVCRRSVKADPRVEPGVQHVRQEVEHDDRDHDEHHPWHQLREVAVLEGRQEVVAHAWVLEDA